ncbi:MAG TPA: SDR family oxidoreductase [Vicinamibacterales bacterium]|nr:SDR family oxidoreductase [Vicinamibacterales bacterium]
MATAVVTGAARGMGREVAIRLARRGFEVLVTDVNEAGAQATADAIGERAWAMAQDVRDPASHRAVAASAAQRGPVEVWVNNAGVLRTEKVWEHSDDDVRMIVDANLLGVIFGSRAAVEAMRPHGGDLINLGSMSAFGPVPGLAVYGATKHGVVAFSGSLQGDLDEEGIPIRVHAVCPDAVDTGMVSERAREDDAAIIFSAGKKLLDPGDVADRIVELLDSNKLLLPIPRARVPLLRLSGWFPRFGLKSAAFFKKVGDRNRRKALEAR